MTILKAITLPNGATASYHRAQNGTVDYVSGEAALRVLSWVTEADISAMLAPSQEQFFTAPAAAIANPEQWLLTQPAFAGGTIVTDPSTTLAGAKIRARQRMAAAWDTARAAGVLVGTKTAPTDAASWTRYLVIKQMAADSGWVDTPILLSDGTFELLTQAKAAALWTALKTLERDLLVRLRDRVEAINAATTIPEVEAVAW